MDSEIKDLLKKTLSVAEENNKMLHKVRGIQKRQAFLSLVKVLIIIGIALGSFYYLEPYLTKVVNIFTQISGIKQQSINMDLLQGVLKKI